MTKTVEKTTSLDGVLNLLDRSNAESLPLPILHADVGLKTLFERFELNLGRPVEARDLQRIKIPAGTSNHFTVPTLADQDGEAKKEIIGIPIFWKQARALFAGNYGEPNASPVPICVSVDGKHGVGKPGRSCNDCTFAEFLDGEKPACKLMIEVYLLTPETLLPQVLVLPPTSIKRWYTYLRNIGQYGALTHGSLVKFTLEKQKNGEGIEYNEAVAEFHGWLTPEQEEALQVFRDEFAEVIAVSRVEDVLSEAGIPDRSENWPFGRFFSSVKGTPLSFETERHEFIGSFSEGTVYSLSEASKILSEDEVERLLFEADEYAKRWRLEHTVEIESPMVEPEYVDVIDASDDKAREVLGY